MQDRIFNFLGEVLPIFTLIIGAFIGNWSAARMAGKQRFDDRLQRWRERRQGLIRQIQEQAYVLSEEAGTAIAMRNSGEAVDREAPWLLRWNEARRDLFNLTELLGDKEMREMAHAFIALQDEVASIRFPQVVQAGELGGAYLSMDKTKVTEQIGRLEAPLNELTTMAGQKYRELEGEEPQYQPPPWWKPFG